VGYDRIYHLVPPYIHMSFVLPYNIFQTFYRCSGALTDGKDTFRFYRMTRTDHRTIDDDPMQTIPRDEILLGDFGDSDSGMTSPYSYHIQLSPTLSGIYVLSSFL
jgi:hypothetical protein